MNFTNPAQSNPTGIFNTSSRPKSPINLFQKPKEQTNTSLFPNPSGYGYSPFNSNPSTQPSKTPQKKGHFPTTNTQTPSIFPPTNPSLSPFSRPTTPPGNSWLPPSSSKPSGVNPNQVQAEVAELIQLKRDSELQKQTMEQMLKRIKELETKNAELETQKTELLQKCVFLENTVKNYQQKPNQQQVPINQPPANTSPIQLLSLQQQHSLMKQNKENPIIFDYSKKDQIFPNSFAPSIFNEDDIYPAAFTEKTFQTTDGYAFQAYVAFNAFYAIKYVILQKVKNNFGYINLTESTANTLTNQSKDKRSQNWYLFHQNSSQNVLAQYLVQDLAKTVVSQMKQNDNTPISILITLSTFLSIRQSKCTVFHPQWTIATPFQLQLYNFYNYNEVNAQTKQIVKQNIDLWISQKTQEHVAKKLNHELVMWFDEAKGVFHIIWH